MNIDYTKIGEFKVSWKDRILLCPKCFGNGFIPEARYVNPELDEYSEIEYDCEECKRCHGTGRRFWIFYKKLP